MGGGLRQWEVGQGSGKCTLTSTALEPHRGVKLVSVWQPSTSVRVQWHVRTAQLCLGKPWVAKAQKFSCYSLSLHS